MKKYTVTVNGTIRQRYTITAESQEIAEEEAMDFFEESIKIPTDWDKVEADAWNEEDV